MDAKTCLQKLQYVGVLAFSTVIGCGKCAGNCPQRCITAGKPCMIQQEHCLHCGCCYENCLVKAVQKRG